MLTPVATGTTSHPTGRPTTGCRTSTSRTECSGAHWRGSSPIRTTTKWPLTMTLHCWSSASRWSSPTPSNPSAYPIPPTSSLQACPAGSQAGARYEKEVLCRNQSWCRAVVILFCTVADYYAHFLIFTLLLLGDGWPTPQLCFSFLHIRLASKLRRPTPPPSLFQLAIHLRPSSSIPVCFLLLPFISFSFHPVFLHSFNVPPISSHLSHHDTLLFRSALPPFSLIFF